MTRFGSFYSEVIDIILAVGQGSLLDPLLLIVTNWPMASVYGAQKVGILLFYSN